MADTDQERTEQATAKRRQDFRDKGQVAQSKEVHTAALLSATLLLWYFYAAPFWRRLSAWLAEMWRVSAASDVTSAAVISLLGQLGMQAALLLAPLLLVVLLVGFFSSFLQIGWLFTFKPLQPDFAKLNPVAGAARFVSKRSLVEVVKSLAKMLLVGTVAFKVVSSEFDRALCLIDMEVFETVRFLGQVALRVLLKSCGILVLLGLLDFLFVRWEMEQKMKMTREEQKEEYKESEGDPHIKSRIRSLQQQMARRRMMAEVPKADVVITNPTHFSVALLYDRSRMDAPQVVAKGADNVAMRIREIARENNVPLVENKLVARALYKIDLGKPVPEELFKAVAEILAYVYGLRR
jgi:flagellar biosynthetic protein FlhB